MDKRQAIKRINAATIANFAALAEMAENSWDSYRVSDSSNPTRWEDAKAENKRDALSELRRLLNEISEWEEVKVRMSCDGIALFANSKQGHYGDRVEIYAEIDELKYDI